MKGVIFTEFLDYIESQYGIPVSDQIITTSGIPEDRVYIASGTYPFGELQQLIGCTHAATGMPVPELLSNFGCHMFAALIRRFPSLADGWEDVYSLLLDVDRKIHVEVGKLFPEAELPLIKADAVDDDTIRLEYRSPRRLADFAEGMLRGCFQHFGEDFALSRRELDSQTGQHAEFILTRRSRGAS